MNAKGPGLGYADFIHLVISALEVAQVDYLIGGAVAGWAWGEPRSTLDLDLVVKLPIESIPDLSRELEKRDMLVPVDIMLDNLLETRADLPINAIHMTTGFKADIYPLRTGDALRESALARKVKVDFGPPIGEVFVHTPEDLIVYKTRYFGLSRQTKHIRDIAAILAINEGSLDIAYLTAWMDREGLTTIWQAVLELLSGKDET